MEKKLYQPFKHKKHSNEQWPEAMQDSDHVSFYPTNKTKLEDLLSNVDV